MRLLARARRRAAAVLQSRALAADAFQTTACFWLSVVTLSGIGLNMVLGWWWADPAALGTTWFIAKEGREAWRGEGCGCDGEALQAPAAKPAASCGCSSGKCSSGAKVSPG